MIQDQMVGITRFIGKVLFLCVFLSASTAYAVPDFLERWRTYYPESNSAEIGCQLCHQRSNGGDGWNGYGFDIRNNYYDTNQISIERAFLDAEQFNSDEDESNLSNIEEINLSLYPGWVNSSTNTIFFKNFSGLFNQPTPFQEMELVTEMPEDDDEFCLPIAGSNGKFALICL